MLELTAKITEEKPIADVFIEEVENYQGIVLVDYWNTGCVNCMGLLPSVEALEKEFGEKVKFCKLNTKPEGQKIARYLISQKVMGLPTIRFFKNGEEVARLGADEASEETIRAKLVELVG